MDLTDVKETKDLTFSNELLDQLRARHPDEGTISVVGHGSCQQGLPCSWGTI